MGGSNWLEMGACQAACAAPEAGEAGSMSSLEQNVMRKDWKMVLRDLQRLDEKDFKEATTWTNANGKTLLHLAAESGFNSPAEKEEFIQPRLIIQELLDKSKWGSNIADINMLTANADKYTPLMCAVQNGNIGACYYFMTKEGCDIELKNGQDQTARELAEDADEEVHHTMMDMFDKKPVAIDWIDHHGAIVKLNVTFKGTTGPRAFDEKRD